MARDDQQDTGRTPVDFPEPVGLAWGSNIFEDREAGARAAAIVKRALADHSRVAPAASVSPNGYKPPER